MELLPKSANELTNAEKFLWMTQAGIRGFYVAERIITEDQTTHYLILKRHIGDIMRLLKYVVLFKRYYSGEDEYIDDYKALKKTITVKKVVIITNRLNSGVCRLFNSVDDVIVLDQDELNDLDIYSRQYSCVHYNLHRDEYYPTVGYGKELDDHRKSSIHGISSYSWVLDIPENIPQKNELILSSIQINSGSVEQAAELLKKYGAKAEKTVIICPYAKSTSAFQDSEWKDFVVHLKEKGFTVFTNVGKNEKELENTLPLFVPVDIYAALGELGCSIIGVQSGILDVVRWMANDTRVTCIHYLTTNRDIKVAANRKLDRDKLIERRLNNTHILIKPERAKDLTEIITGEFLFTEKSLWQYEMYKNRPGDTELHKAVDLNSYAVALSKMSNVVVFMSVYDSANKYWSSFNRAQLGLQCDLSDKWRKSYIAVIDRDNDFVYEDMAQNYREVRYQGEFDDTSSGTEYPAANNYYLTSHAMHVIGSVKYTRSTIVINGKQYSLGGRGLNIVVYSKEKGYVIDNVSVDLWDDEELKIRR